MPREFLSQYRGPYFEKLRKLFFSEVSVFKIHSPITPQKIDNLEIAPITEIEAISPNFKAKLTYKRIQYTRKELEYTIYPSSKKCNSIADLNTLEGRDLFQFAYDVISQFLQVEQSKYPVNIGINYQRNVTEQGDNCLKKAQTIKQLHVHVFGGSDESSAQLPWGNLQKAEKRKLFDSYIPVISELLSSYFRESGVNQEIWGDTNIQYNQFPLGLNRTLKNGLKTLEHPDFFEELLKVHNAYNGIYDSLADLFVNREKRNANLEPEILPIEERMENVNVFLAQHPELSRYSQLLLKTTARQLKISDEVPFYNTFITDSAYTFLISGTDENAFLSIQPRIISSGNPPTIQGKVISKERVIGIPPEKWLAHLKKIKIICNNLIQKKRPGWEIKMGPVLENMKR